MSELIIQQKLDFISKALETIIDIMSEYRDASGKSKEYLFFAAQKKTEEIIEAAITINQKILKDNFGHISPTYFDSFKDLKKLSSFTDVELEKLAKTAGFRNRLAHEYLNLDPDVTLKSIENILKIYPDYLKSIKKYIRNKL